jgi:hypothetical protein
MTYACIKAGAALLVLGGFAIATPALAVAPPALTHVPALIPVQDEENAEVWHDLRPDITPPEAAVGNEDEQKAAKEAAPEPPKEEGSGNVEEKELKEDGLIPE